LQAGDTTAGNAPASSLAASTGAGLLG
jgi:hypothetical protein